MTSNVMESTKDHAIIATKTRDRTGLRGLLIVHDVHLQVGLEPDALARGSTSRSCSQARVEGIRPRG